MDPYTFPKSNFFQSRFEIQGAMKCECQEAIAPVTFFFESPFVRDQILKAKPPTSVQPSAGVSRLGLPEFVAQKPACVKVFHSFEKPSLRSIQVQFP